ncbi:hypothetical protein HMF3257_39125 [Spirosoma telluris]|uniref:Uncharacterized protein n=1 Tax=Spirosoma telluris TaxID=2183553 RepID=A0A327NK43_9BACT|nr:hypothetical protein HMF3257_39125 [Spirosoma telluris]
MDMTSATEKSASMADLPPKRNSSSSGSPTWGQYKGKLNADQLAHLTTHLRNDSVSQLTQVQAYMAFFFQRGIFTR